MSDHRITPEARRRAEARRDIAAAMSEVVGRIDALDSDGLNTNEIARLAIVPEAEVYNYLFQRGWP